METMETTAPAYPFVETDGGRGKSKRPGQRRDCTVRALAVATGMDYDRAYEVMAEAGRKSSQAFEWTKWAADGRQVAVDAPDGAPVTFTLERVTFPAVKGQERMNPRRFCQEYPEGRWIVQVAKHVAAVVDGVYMDAEPEREDRCIYSAWRLVPDREVEAAPPPEPAPERQPHDPTPDPNPLPDPGPKVEAEPEPEPELEPEYLDQDPEPVMSNQDLVRWRKAMGWSKRRAAAELDMSYSNYRYMEDGRREDGRRVTIDRRTALACAALHFGLHPWPHGGQE